MPLLPIRRMPWPAWLATLKFKIMLLAAATGMLSAVGTVQLVMPSAQQSIEQLLLDGAGQERESLAALLSGKLQMLQTVLQSSAGQLSAADMAAPAVLERHLRQVPALETLFKSLFAIAPDGRMLVRLDQGVASHELLNLADRDYFRQLQRSDQPVVSAPIRSRVRHMPVVVIAVPVLDADRRMIGAIAGAIELRSSALFSDMLSGNREQGTRDLIMDRQGTLLAHTDPDRVLGQASDEPGLAAIAHAWLASGSPIDTTGSGQRSGGHLVSMAGIPLSDWVLVRLTPESVAMAPAQAARRAAWAAAAVIGLVAAALAGAAGWFMTQPISRLRDRAERLLLEPEGTVSAWPRSAGEIGALGLAFEQLVGQRAQRHGEAQALLAQLEAVLDHAEVGIALSRNGRFELVSRHFCHLFRCEKHDAVGQPTRMIYPSDEAFAALAERARPAFMAHGAFDGELQLLRRSGQLFWAQMRGRAVVPGDQGQGTIWTVEDVTAARAQRERLSYTASHDGLTGLANRGAFEQELEAATAQARQAPFSALFIDLDRFKQVNDSGGHAAGDALLRDVAQCIAAQLRKSDTVARLGGDEFAVLLPDCPPARATRLAEQIRSAVLAYRLQWEGQSHGVGASIGLVHVDGALATAAEVLRAADAACYAAKRAGRNRSSWASDTAGEALPA